MDIRTELGVDLLLEQVRSNKRSWCERLERIAGDRIRVLEMEYNPVGKREVGRPSPDTGSG